MFKEWGFLLGEIWVLLALAALLGLLAGWLIWGGKSKADTAEADRLRGDLERARQKAATAEAELARLGQMSQEGASSAEAASHLRDQLDVCHDARSEAEAQIEALEAELAASGGGDADREARLAAEARVAALEAELAAAGDAGAEIARLQADLAACEARADVVPADADADANAEGFADVGQRPEGLSAARDGQPDDLKLIKGVGPKLEKLCNSLGFWHFDQVAAWTADEVAWVDENLEGFKGRVTRDEWVEQAKSLAAGNPPRE